MSVEDWSLSSIKTAWKSESRIENALVEIKTQRRKETRMILENALVEIKTQRRKETRMILCPCLDLRGRPLLVWILLFLTLCGISASSLYAYWNPIAETINSYRATDLIILNLNMTNFSCCDILNCMCGNCVSDLSCDGLKQNIQEGSCCLPNQCVLNAKTQQTSPTQACSVTCGTCWNVSRNISLKQMNLTRHEELTCWRDDLPCLQQEVSNRTVWVSGNQNNYLYQLPKPDPFSICTSVVIVLGA
jgi:hypothetical protein